MASPRRQPAARFALAMYPRSVRERYGDEIADLMAESPRPIRDLIDVAWCALIEQGNLMSTPQLRSRVPKVAGVLAVPFLLSAALLAVASFGILIVATVDPGADQTFAEAVIALAVVPVSAGAVWLGWRVSRNPSVSAWHLFVPALLAVGTLVLASVPIVGEALGEDRVAVAVATVLWCLIMTGLVVAASRLAQRLPWWAVAITMIAVGFAALDLTFVAYAALAAPPNGSSTPSYWWYPAAVTAQDFGRPGAASNLSEDLKALPALLTACTAFTLSLAWARARRSEEGQSFTPKASRNTR